MLLMLKKARILPDATTAEMKITGSLKTGFFLLLIICCYVTK
jgi:hypothetical protein